MMDWLKSGWITVAVVGLVLAALVAVLFSPIDGDTKADVALAIAAVGTALAGALRGVAKIIPIGLALALSTQLVGCGSVVQAQARAATIAAVATQGAARVVEETAAHEARTSCPHATYAPRSPELSACLAPLRARWTPADVAIASTRAALEAWVSALEIASIAGDGADLWQPLAIAAARLVREYDALAAVLRELGVDTPALPAPVLDATMLIGGE